MVQKHSGLTPMYIGTRVTSASSGRPDYCPMPKPEEVNFSSEQLRGAIAATDEYRLDEYIDTLPPLEEDL